MHRIAAVLLGAVALGLGAVTWLRGRPEPAASQVEPTRQVAPSDPAPGPEVALDGVARSGDRAVGTNAPRERSRPDPDKPSPAPGRPMDPVAAATTAPRGALLVHGRVEFDEADALPADAQVVATLVGEDERPVGAYARTPVSPDGGFACSLPGWGALSIEQRGRRWVEVRFRASGFTSAAEVFSVSDEPFSTGVAQAEVELYAQPLVAGLTGRVIGADGEPLAAVQVDSVLWQTGGGMSETLTARTGADGRFEIDAWEPGACTVHAAHVEHGSAVRTVELGEGRADIGDLILVPRGVLAGRVVSADGVGLPNVPIEVRRDDESNEFGTVTDAEGRFRFADLPRVPHELLLPGVDDEVGPRTFVPDATDIVLPVRIHVAVFRLVEPAGLEIDDVDWSVVRLDGKSGTQRSAGESWLTDAGDTLVVTLPRPGEYALSARLERDPSFVAFLPFTAARDSARLDVRLRRAAGTPVTLRVEDPEQREVDGWRVRYRGVERRAEAGWFARDEPTVELLPGTWQLQVRLPSESVWAPVTSTLEVEGGAAREHVLRLTELAGRIEFDSPSHGPGELMIFVHGPGRRGPSYHRAFAPAPGGAAVASSWRLRKI
ncbi:MAG: carboxypeptidase regulatory-like domain-containing protein, partial [Planctomycetota bacterium]